MTGDILTILASVASSLAGYFLVRWLMGRGGHWRVRIAFNADGTAWSTPFGPYRTERHALRYGERIQGFRGYPMRAEKVER